MNRYAKIDRLKIHIGTKRYGLRAVKIYSITVDTD